MSTSTVLENLAVSKVHPDPNNPRSSLDNIDDLAASIRSGGLVEPVVVRAHPERAGEWMIVAGHRRHAAHVKAGIKTIPAVVRDMDDAQAVAVMLVENLQREDLDPLDEAGAYRRLVGFGWKQKDIADATGRSAAHVSKRLRLLDLPEPVAKAVRAGEVTVETGYVVAKTLATKGLDPAPLLEEIGQLLDTPSNSPDREFVDSDVKDAAERVAGRFEYEAKAEDVRCQLVLAGQTELLAADYRLHRKVEGYNAFPVDYDEHLKEPCSAFVVVNRGGDPVPEYWCVDPNRHRADGDSRVKVPDETAQREAARAEMEREQDEKARARQLAADKRRSFYTDAVSRSALTGDGRLPVNQFAQFHQATRMLIHTLNSTDLELVAELLDLDGWKRSVSHGEKQQRILAAFDESPVATNLAVILALTESVMTYYHVRPDPHDYRLQFLEQLGYGGEQTTLEGVAS